MKFLEFEGAYQRWGRNGLYIHEYGVGDNTFVLSLCHMERLKRKTQKERGKTVKVKMMEETGKR
jgi:hypothetical protein